MKIMLMLFVTTISTMFNSASTLPIDDETEEYYVSVEKIPVLIGGYELLQKKLKYPYEARMNSIEDKVYVLAYINEVGECVDAKIVKGIGYGCNEESLRVIKSSRFIPGENNSVKVKTKLTLAITFKLNYN